MTKPKGICQACGDEVTAGFTHQVFVPTGDVPDYKHVVAIDGRKVSHWVKDIDGKTVSGAMVICGIVIYDKAEFKAGTAIKLPPNVQIYPNYVSQYDWVTPDTAYQPYSNNAYAMNLDATQWKIAAYKSTYIPNKK